MLKLQVEDELLGTLIESVAPLVQKYTNWDLQLPLLRWRVIPRERGYEEVFLGRMRGAGIPVNETMPGSFNQRLTEHLIEIGTLAAYEPSQAEVLVVRENVDDSNIDGLRLVLAHELVHRAQHIRFPVLFAHIDEMIRNQWFAAITCRWLNPVREQALLERAMSLLESHAAFIQGQLGQEYFSLARIETSCGATAMLLRILGGGKISQYTRALPKVAEAVQRGSLDELFDTVLP
jgi:hypothetical protein